MRFMRKRIKKESSGDADLQGVKVIKVTCCGESGAKSSCTAGTELQPVKTSCCSEKGESLHCASDATLQPAEGKSRCCGDKGEKLPCLFHAPPSRSQRRPRARAAVTKASSHPALPSPPSRSQWRPRARAAVTKASSHSAPPSPPSRSQWRSRTRVASKARSRTALLLQGSASRGANCHERGVKSQCAEEDVEPLAFSLSTYV